MARQYAENRTLKDGERHILDRRKALLAAYAMAQRQDDEDTALEVRRKILAFNKAYPEKPITGQTIRRSLRAQAAYSERAEHGVVYTIAPYASALPMRRAWAIDSNVRSVKRLTDACVALPTCIPGRQAIAKT